MHVQQHKERDKLTQVMETTAKQIIAETSEDWAQGLSIGVDVS